jgi:hypothetical protein
VRSKLTVLAIPTLLWRAVSSNIHYWALDFHYDVILWPIGLLAFVDVITGRPGGSSSGGAERRSVSRPDGLDGGLSAARSAALSSARNERVSRGSARDERVSRGSARDERVSKGSPEERKGGGHIETRLPTWQKACVGVAVIAGLALAVSEMADRSVAPSSLFRSATVVQDIRSLAAHHLPKDARVATQADVGAYLVPTYDAYSLRPDQHPSVDYVMFTAKPKWLYQVPNCAKEKLIRDAEQVWRRGTVTLVKLPHRQRVTPSC